MTGVLIKINLDTFIEGRQCEKTEGEDSHLQAKERGLEQIPPSQPSEGHLDFEHLDSRTVRQ